MIREKGTDRSRMMRGEVDRYTWRDLGSSYLLSDLQAAYLWGNLEAAEAITARRMAIWEAYRDAFAELAARGQVTLPTIPASAGHNAHLFYLKLADREERTRFMGHMKAAGISTAFHYIPLHTSPAGRAHGRFHGEDRFTTAESERLVRLPLYHGLQDDAVHAVIRAVMAFFA